MDKKVKESLRHAKKSKHTSSDSSNSSDTTSSSSSYSSSDSHKKQRIAKRRPPNKLRSSSSSADEEKNRQRCEKLEAKRNHLKRKLKEARLKKRAAAAAAVLTGHSQRSLSPQTQAKIKRIAERKQYYSSKSRRDKNKERHKHAGKERERDGRQKKSRSPAKATKSRAHRDSKRHKSPQRIHQQLMTHEKLIIQTRGRDQAPSPTEVEKQRYDRSRPRERARQERSHERTEQSTSTRDKERIEAARRSRQREKDFMIRENLQREDRGRTIFYTERERSKRVLSRLGERGNDADSLPQIYFNHDRTLEDIEAQRGQHILRGSMDSFSQDREYFEIKQTEPMMKSSCAGDPTNSRSYSVNSAHRNELSPGRDHYGSRLGNVRPHYSDLKHKRPFVRDYLHNVQQQQSHNEMDQWGKTQDMRECHLRKFKERDFPDVDHVYSHAGEHEPQTHIIHNNRTNRANEWDAHCKYDWNELKVPKLALQEDINRKNSNISASRLSSEPDWDADEIEPFENPSINMDEDKQQQKTNPWFEHSKFSHLQEKLDMADWHENEKTRNLTSGGLVHSRTERPLRGYRRTALDGGERAIQEGSHFKTHPQPLMNLPVHPPGGFQGSVSRFPVKRFLVSSNLNVIKKHQVALATTAVAAAKAAAQSAASATTNPSILGQCGARQQKDPTERDHDLIELDEISKSTASQNIITETLKVETLLDNPGEDLSEISESEDEILDTYEKKPKFETNEPSQDIVLPDTESLKELTKKQETDEMLDFEEISDCELEEDVRQKGVGDALGVDWASLIAYTNRQIKRTATVVDDQHRKAKQRWQPHRIILEIGVSMKMSSESYAKKILTCAQEKLKEELQNTLKSKSDEFSTSNKNETKISVNEETMQDEQERKISSESLPDPEFQKILFNVDSLHPLACIQTSTRKRSEEKLNIFTKACGPNSRALCAYRDMKLRRALCGLPVLDSALPRPIPTTNLKLKVLALTAFKKAISVE